MDDDTADVCAVCTASCASGKYMSTACTAEADIVCTDCPAVANVLASTTYTCADASTTRLVEGASGCAARYEFVAGGATSADSCKAISGVCSGNSDAATDVTCAAAGTHLIVSTNDACWDGGSFTSDRCCDTDTSPSGDVQCWSGAYTYSSCCLASGMDEASCC